MKPIRCSNHAALQMALRGATEKEVITAIRLGKWGSARIGKLKTKYRFDYNMASLINQKVYKFKTVEAIFTDESDEIVVITVKVYYSNEEGES